MALNPVKLASLQADSTVDNDWEAAMRRIMALGVGERRQFSAQPVANRLQAILQAVVPARSNPTHEKVLAIVNALAETGAIRKDEIAGVYDALLRRVAKFNSTNVQSNLTTLVSDVREAVAQKVRHEAANLGSLAALNSFLSIQPATVARGQNDYMGFINALRLLVAEVPNTEVYRTGPDFFLQSTRNGTQTVNLSRAFQNLRDLWGVAAPDQARLSISSLLTPNTRLLLLLVAPFTDTQSVSRDSYLGYLLTLYREALGRANVGDQTRAEIQTVSEAIGQTPNNLESTLNFLLTNRVTTRPAEYRLSNEEEKVLRYLQQAISLQMSQNHRSPAEALDAVAASIDTTFYARHRVFIMRLLDFFRRALTASRAYFFDAVMNAQWQPPEGFYLGAFDFPPVPEDYIWEDEALPTTQSEDTVPSGAAAKPTYSKSNLSKEVASLSQRLKKSWTFKAPSQPYRAPMQEDSDEESASFSQEKAQTHTAGLFDHLKPQGGMQS